MDLRSSEPFWLQKNGLLNSYPSLQEDLETEILIVGGEITGSLIAHQCINDGFQTTLIDRRDIANGSTAATTSMLQYEIDVPLSALIAKIGKEAAIQNYQACSDAIDTLGALVKEVKSKCGFKKKKSLYFAAYKKDVAALKREFNARKEAGFPVKWLESETIEELYGVSHTHGGILSDQAGSIDAYKLAHDLLKFNSKKGLCIYDKTIIAHVDYGKNGVQVSLENGRHIKCKKLIYCNGFESTEIIRENFVKLLSTYAIVGEQQPEKLHMENLVVWNTANPYIYMRTTTDHRILIGGEDEDYVSSTRREANLEKKAKKLEKKVWQLLPDTAFKRDFAWAGTFGETKDGLPYIGIHPDFDSTYFVLGFGGNGITFSVTGMELVSCFLAGKSHKLSEYYRFQRN
ncbi:NAD(P)/FAD-dependent oxidoreductase [Christiangramia portivictoriae]|uniref:NAD(P)/FAD-dependent oxidoreductase n=1 Tax=Christiangramia portivictoriae TaxID=326069 RepID=UPI000402407C|nr:FAD-binding oxidoreductase [Christiangramia portivictoriae]